ncbi:MAG: Eco57I restriction-modification methylase domain-containing protein [Phycisphaeraceae bacterium]|nr:Eco57I restriction-modification methylase domain-containing protein [Phycisphaeraceae bacterium]
MISGQHHPNEARRQAIQSVIDGAKSAAERNRLGQFATPYTLAVGIAGFVRSLIPQDHCTIHFADPSIGSGSFFSAALTVFGRRRIKSAVGVEIDPAFCGAARDLWASDGLEVVQGDFSRVAADKSRPPAPNLILANPPYVRHHHMNRQDKERLQRLALKMTGVEVSGLAGLYVYFLLLATAWMQRDGLAAWLIPSEFMDVNYGGALRDFLTDQVTLLRSHRFDPSDVQFGDALVSSAVLVFRKAPPPPGHEPEFTFGGTLDKPQARERLSLDRLRASRKWTSHPDHPKHTRRTFGDQDSPRLSDLFRIRRGIATGSNKFFVLDRSDAKQRGLPEDCLRPILPSPRHLKATVIEAEKDGYPNIDRQLCLIDCDLPEPMVKSKFPALWEYLQTARSLGILDRYLISKRTPWYKQEFRAPAPFLCTYMGRGSEDKQPFRFILNRSTAIGTNLYLMMYPRQGLAGLLRESPDSVDEIHRLLSRVTGHELRGEGRVYGGGLNKIEPSELGRISAAPFIERWPELGNYIGQAAAPSLFQ